MAKERLQKVLAHAGIASRRKCEGLIREGRVRVNGHLVVTLGTKVDAEVDVIEVDGKQVNKALTYVYILYHKPSGVVCTVTDPQGRLTVVDAVNYPQRVYPVGRLDMDTTGLLLLTNDGQFAYQMTHPSHQVAKTYVATVKGRINATTLRKLEQGVMLADGMTAPASCRLCALHNNMSVIEITIHEGRKRQVRRMFEHVGHRVLKLHRSRIGSLELDGLKPGQWRLLTKNEIQALQNS